MISSWRPRKASKPNTRCSTVAARCAPSGTAGAFATTGAPGTAGVSASPGVLAPGSLGEDAEKDSGAPLTLTHRSVQIPDERGVLPPARRGLPARPAQPNPAR